MFALYVAGYSGFRIFEELLRVDPAHHILGLRLNFYIATLLFIAGLAWFVLTQGGWSRARRSATRGGRAAPWPRLGRLRPRLRQLAHARRERGQLHG